MGIEATDTEFEALAWAIDEAQTRRVPLVLVHGVGASAASWIELEPVDLRDVVDTMTTQGQEVLRRAARQVALVAPAVEVHQVLRMTSARQALMDLADEAAMIVVGSRSGRGPEESVPDLALACVVGRARCPVVVPRSRTTTGGGVVVLCDGSPRSRAVLDHAGDHAQRRSLPLSVVCCLPDPPAALGQQDLSSTDATARTGAGTGPSSSGFERRLVGDLVSEMRMRRPGIDVRAVVDDQAVDDCLSRAGRSADLLVAGASHARRVGELVLGTRTAGQAACVTIVLPQEDGRPVVSEPRILIARLHGAAHRLTVIDASPDQAIRELLTITRDHGLLTEAGVAALKGWAAGATKTWQTPEVAELLIRAAVDTCPAHVEGVLTADDEPQQAAS